MTDTNKIPLDPRHKVADLDKVLKGFTDELAVLCIKHGVNAIGYIAGFKTENWTEQTPEVAITVGGSDWQEQLQKIAASSIEGEVKKVAIVG